MSEMSAYESENIIVVEGLEAVRKRPGMYVGGTDQQALNHLGIELIDNAIDESGVFHQVSPHEKFLIDVICHMDGSFSVRDNGRGIPMGRHVKTDSSTVELLFMRLHSGGKFDSQSYQTSAGLHGVGLAVVNALSVRTFVHTWRSPISEEGVFSRGQILEPVHPTAPGPTPSGTYVRIWPDAEIFGEGAEIEYSALRNRLRYLAFLNKNTVLTIFNERSQSSESFDREHGIRDYVVYLNKDKTPLTPLLYFEDVQEEKYVEIAMQYTRGYDETVRSYVNNIETEDGTHLTGLRTSLTKTVLEQIGDHADSKGEIEITGADVREGLTLVLNIRMRDPQFEGQTKRRIGNRDLAKAISTVVRTKLGTIMSRDSSFVQTLREKIRNAAVSRYNARKVLEMSRERSYGSILSVVSKLAECSIRDPTKTELFLVEGLSAGGTAKAARNRKLQAVLPLRGKILNVERGGETRMLLNEEIKNLIAAIGVGVGDLVDLTKLRYSKIIIMTDADVDGAHIKVLLITFFYRYLRPLLDAGHVYVAEPPLFAIERGETKTFVHDERALQQIELPRGAKLKRYKGLGEMNPAELWTSTMDPELQNKFAVSVSAFEEGRADELVATLMGKQVEGRKRFILENYSKVENLDI